MANKKQIGVWMDTQQATIVGRLEEGGNIEMLGVVNGEANSSNSSEKTGNNQEKTLQVKYFKEIATYLQNATLVHVTGTGQAQEQFIHYLEDTPQFKNLATAECTSNKMSDERLIEFMADKLN